MNILSKDILPLKTSQKFSSVLEPYAVKVARKVLNGESGGNAADLHNRNNKVSFHDQTS